MKKLRHKELEQFTLGCPATEWKSWDLKLKNLVPESGIFPTEL